MATNRGTSEGNEQEILFVKEFNKNKALPKFSLLLENKNLENTFMVRVTTNQPSTLSNKITKTRADCYLINCEDKLIQNILKTNNFYLDEGMLKNIKYNFIEFSGISVKLEDSEKYQILKMGPSSFYKLFDSYELGAGASLFCKKNGELIKNKELLQGWNTTAEKMKNYFSFVNSENDFFNNKEICSKIKTYCNELITTKINNSEELQKKIFNGYPIYSEPYSAWYLYSNGQITKLSCIPFMVTTGSGRSHGDYTIVLKPNKKEDN